MGRLAPLLAAATSTWDRTGAGGQDHDARHITTPSRGCIQIEAADGSDGGGPDLLLVSIGLQQSDQSSNSFTIPMLVNASSSGSH